MLHLQLNCDCVKKWFMKIEKIREVLHAQPFQPFWTHLADGGRVPVKHEDFVAVDPRGRELIVFLPDG